MVRSRSDSVSKLLAIETEVPQNVFYTIAAPKSFRPFSVFNVAVTLNDPENVLNESITFRVHIEDAEDERNYVNEHRSEVKPNSTEVIPIHIEELALSSEYKLVVMALSETVKFRHEAPLILQSKTHAILVQTDKVKYKPKDIVQFRVLVLDAQLKAAALPWEKLNVHVVDGNYNRIKQWNKVDTIKGVFEADLQLSDEPNLGTWQIIAEVGNEETTKSFEVEEYVPPKFEINIASAPLHSIHDERMSCVVTAKYTFGKPVKGKAIVSLVSSDYDKLRAKKTVPLGETVSFSMKDEVKESGYYSFDVEVLEDATELSRSESKSVHVCKYGFKGTLEADKKYFTPDEPFKIKIRVTKYDGTPLVIGDHNKRIKILREENVQYMNDGDYHQERNEIMEEYNLSANGEINMTFSLTDDHNSFNIKVFYETENICTRMFYKERTLFNSVPIRAKLDKENASVGDEINVNVTSNETLKSYYYYIVANKRIVDAKTIQLDNDANEKSHNFKFTVPPDMAGRVYVVVLKSNENNIFHDTVSVDVKDDLQGKIELELSSEQMKPGDTVDISVKTAPKAYVGLLGVDKSVRLMGDSNDLSVEQAIETRYRFQRTHTYYSYHDCANYWGDLYQADLIAFTNVKPKISDESCEVLRMCKSKKRCIMKKRGRFSSDTEVVMCAMSAPAHIEATEQVPKPVIRKDFPETWIWESIVDDNFNGLEKLRKIVPDTITTWILTAFSIDPIDGLAITREPKALTVFQPFFVSIDLPYSVKRGEVLKVPCSVSNYQKEDLTVSMFIESSEDFEIIDTKTNEAVKTEPHRLVVPQNDSTTAWFPIRPKKVGEIQLKLTALADKSNEQDCMIKTLLVEPEGVPQYVNTSLFIDLREKRQFEPTVIDIEIPDDALIDSERIEVHCVGDLLGGTIKNLQKLIRLPYGCGEQNMMNFVPNIVILNYLKNTHQLTPEVEKKVKFYTEIGYQRQLTYKHQDGSFSAFGHNDKNGCTWLTAFVVKSFRQAAEHILIDEEAIQNALQFLKNAQKEDGSFEEKGRIFDQEMQSGSAKGIALTAYVLTAFLESKEQHSDYKDVMEKAVKNIEKSLNEITDPYALAVITYALQHTDVPARHEALEKLRKIAKNDREHVWWEKVKPKKDESKCCQQPITYNTELTAYGLLALMKANVAGSENEQLQVLKWLLRQRNSKGGFEGTQDTVLGLEALAKYAEKIASKEHNVHVEFSSEKSSGLFQIDDKNLLIRQSELLAQNTRKVNIQATGKGFALVEISYKYHIKEPNRKSDAFNLRHEVNCYDPDNFNLKTFVSFSSMTGNDVKSNMAIMEINVPSGFIVDKESLEATRNAIGTVKRVETKNADTVAVVYLDYIDRTELALTFHGSRKHEVEHLKPALIAVYDYYDSELRRESFYSLPAQ